mgnify:CR=1 FL=1
MNFSSPKSLLPISDLFIIPSANESLGLAALEAMAWEVPVMSSNVGGLPEVNAPGVSGYLSEVGDVADMAAKALTILQDDLTLERFKKQSLAHAAKFDIKKIVPLYEALYESVLNPA